MLDRGGGDDGSWNDWNEELSGGDHGGGGDGGTPRILSRSWKGDYSVARGTATKLKMLSEHAAALLAQGYARGDITQAMVDFTIGAIDQSVVEKAVCEAFKRQEQKGDDGPTESAQPIEPPDDQPPPPAVKSLKLIRPRDWKGTVIQPPRWIVRNRIPIADVSLYVGDGATGKTTTALQLGANVVRGAPDWLGAVIDVEPGPVLIFSGEEPEWVIRWHLNNIGKKQGFDYLELDNLYLCFVDPSESLLGIADRQTIIKPTPLFRLLEVWVMENRPALVIIDNVAATYGGNQLDRTQARAYVSMFRSLAHKSGAGILLLDHPTQSGMKSGTGRGGSNDWHNSVRARIYLSEIESEGEVQADPDLRLFEVKKTSYSKKGETLKLRYDEGTFVVDGTPSPLTKIASETEAENLFLALLDKFSARKIEVGCKPGPNFAPSVFSKDPDAKGYKPAALKAAMERLFKAGRIDLDERGPASKRRHPIIRSEDKKVS
jgi:RecA-family ATPase